MMQIGIEDSRNIVYEGDGRYGHAIWPSPYFSPATFIAEGSEHIPTSKSSHLHGTDCLFREDSFDPATRIRRGRFYFIGQTQPVNWSLEHHPALPDEALSKTRGRISKMLQTFEAQPIASKIRQIKEQQCIVLLGTGDRYSIWTIINIEAISTGEDLITLKARSSFGILPIIGIQVVPAEKQALVRETLDAFADEVHRSAPVSVIDRAREAIAQCLLVYFKLGASNAQDLGGLAKRLRENDMQVAAGAADIVARLHARAKPVERTKRPLRSIREQDAELATQCVGTILCEIGWADWA